eukprot:31649-Rhodomonas_salina.1
MGMGMATTVGVGMWECGNVGMWECGDVGMWFVVLCLGGLRAGRDLALESADLHLQQLHALRGRRLLPVPAGGGGGGEEE